MTPKISSVKFSKLLEPGYIGKLRTRNRIIKTGAGPGAWSIATNTVTPEGLAFVLAMAKGGVGVINSGAAAFAPGITGAGTLYSDDTIPVHREYVDAIHKYDCPVFILWEDMRPMGLGTVAIASSAVNYPTKFDLNNALPRALTLEEIQQEVDQVASATVRAQEAGYDGAEINAACSHMFDTFLSRFWNRREDQYGPQSLENRARIVVEMIQEIKKRCGADYPVSVLYNGREVNVFEVGNDEYCISIEEGIEFAKLFEQAGADLLHIRSATFGDHCKGFFPELFYLTGAADNSYGYAYDLKKFWPEFVTRYGGAGAFIETAAKIKQAVSIPVETVGGMNPRLLPEVVENAIRDGKIDFIGMTRPLFADPELPNKLAAGRLDDIRPCTYCYTCFQGGSEFCRVNAGFLRAGGDSMPEGYDVRPATTKKKVLVVGGGPAGMEAARVAALRGHRVTLYEESTRLGGLMPMAAMVKGPHEKILDFVNYLSNQITKLGVKVKLGKKVNLSVVKKLKPDVAIIATGGAYATPNIPGIDNPKVVSGASLHRMLKTGLRYFSPFTLRSLTNFYMPIGQKVVVIGGQIQGIEVAEFFVHRHKDVTIVDEEVIKDDPGGPPAGSLGGPPAGSPGGPSSTPTSYLGKGMPGTTRDRLIYYLRAHGVKILTGVKYNEITDEGLIITLSNGLKKTLKADSIVLALPLMANTALADSLKGTVNEVYAIGDCKIPGVIETSIADANLTARKI